MFDGRLVPGLFAAPNGQATITTADFLRRTTVEKVAQRVAIIAAHPDDETIGAGVLLTFLQNPILIHTTDGAPRDLVDALAAGYAIRSDYAKARREELKGALATGGITADKLLQLGFADQEGSAHLVEMSFALLEHLHRLRPDAVVTHPYEGGHPDHDATAFAVHTACALLREHDEPVPAIIEMTSYHNLGGEMAVAKFLSHTHDGEATLELSREQQQIKRRMFDAFTTQLRVLSAFPIESEIFRVAPAYNFTLPPHQGRLFYENFHWGTTGTRWRNLARNALEKLGLSADAEAADTTALVK
jgi:LmbE family N-acetylglucosaminyl deacetylase